MPVEFARLLDAFAEAGVDYLVVGGVAVCLNGFVRYTDDLDIILKAEPTNARRLLGVLSDWGEGHARELDVSEFVPAGLGAIRIIEDFALDVFTTMRAQGADSELDFEQLAPDARVYRTERGSPVRFISIPRLIELKTGTGRDKDRLDLANLEEIRRGGREVQSVRLEDLERPPAGDREGRNEDDGDEWPLRR